MSETLIINCRKTYSGFNLDISEEISLDGITAIFGPSGAGKSSLLKMIAGVETPDEGSISFGKTTWFDKGANIAAHRRAAGYLFQSGSLFAHFTVEKNLRFADRRSQHIKKNITLERVIAALDLKPLLPRKPLGLSGGETQRAALGRLILSRPQMLLLDEPLTGLDRSRKRDLLALIKSLTTEFALPCLYVSHNIEEVMALADRVLILKDGKVQAHGPATQTLNLIDTLPLTDLDIEPGSVFDAHVQDVNNEMMALKIGNTALSLPRQSGIQPSQKIRLKIRSQDVSIATQRPEHISIQNCLKGQINDITPVDGTVFFDIGISLSGTAASHLILKSQITRQAMDNLNLSIGQDVFALVKTASLQR